MTSNRLRRPRRLVAVASLCVLALAGCGTDLHPGDAVVVNGTAISQAQVDSLVTAVCNYQKVEREAQGASKPSTSVAFLRSRLASDLISFKLKDKAAQDLGLEVTPAEVARLAGQSTVPKGLDGQDAGLIRGYFEDVARSNLEQALIGAHLKNPKVTSAEKVTQADLNAATPYMTAFAKKQHVTVNPSYGRWDGSSNQAVSGSLSDPVSAAAKAQLSSASKLDAPAGTPASQVCG
ncbi:MAG: SurA N-terminal domain-containing protein [Nocardioidaceae bacterium]